MYGTVARVHLKPGTEQRLQELVSRFEEARVPGAVAEYVYRSDSDPNEYYMAVVFQDRETYVANADSPEQDARYREMAELFSDEPEWHDGEIIYSSAQKEVVKTS